jgi:hypothetical protein
VPTDLTRVETFSGAACLTKFPVMQRSDTNIVGSSSNGPKRLPSRRVPRLTRSLLYAAIPQIARPHPDILSISSINLISIFNWNPREASRIERCSCVARTDLSVRPIESAMRLPPYFNGACNNLQELS